MKSNDQELAGLHPQVLSDLRYALSYFPLASLILLRESKNNLLRGRFAKGPNGCVFNLLSRVLPASQRITDKASLTRFFTGGSADVDRKYPEMECYQPARNLVRLWDNNAIHCIPPERYGETTQLSVDQLMAFLDVEIQRRLALEDEARAVEESARQRQRQLI